MTKLFRGFSMKQNKKGERQNGPGNENSIETEAREKKTCYLAISSNLGSAPRRSREQPLRPMARGRHTAEMIERRLCMREK